MEHWSDALAKSSITAVVWARMRFEHALLPLANGWSRVEVTRKAVRYHETILVVEDDQSYQILIREAFRAVGVQNPLQFASSGFEAIAYLMGEGKFSDRKAYPYPTFIITDLNMPAGNGLSVLEHIKRNQDWDIIPKVVLTSSEDPDDIKKAYRLGASCYHLKPGSQKELCQFLKTLHEYWMTCKVPEVDYRKTG